MANIDWVKVKNEYITTNISQRKLAEKYSVSSRTIAIKSKEENWVELKKQKESEISAKLQQKTTEIIIENEVDRLAGIIEISDLLATKIKAAIDQLEKTVVDGKIVETGIVDTYKLRQLVQSTKDLRDVVRSDNDSRDIKKLDAVLDKIEGNI